MDLARFDPVADAFEVGLSEPAYRILVMKRALARSDAELFGRRHHYEAVARRLSAQVIGESMEETQMQVSKHQPKKSKVISMVVTVPCVDGLSEASHRKAVRDAVRGSGDFYGRAVKVVPVSSLPVIALEVRDMK